MFDSKSGQTITLKLVFAAFLLDAQQRRDSVENKLVSLLAVPLEKALGEVLPSWRYRQMAGSF